jgi:hypothetical protein
MGGGPTLINRLISTDPLLLVGSDPYFFQFQVVLL